MSHDWQRDLKCALRDLGLAARKVDFSLPEAADIMRHIHDCEEGLKGLVEGKPFVEMNRDENVRRLNTARSEWYVELGRVIYDSVSPGELPDNLRLLVENVTRLEVKRHLVGPPKLTSGGRGGVGAPVMGLGSGSRLRTWLNLAFAAAAIAAVVITVWILYGPSLGTPAPRTPRTVPDGTQISKTVQVTPPEQSDPAPEQADPGQPPPVKNSSGIPDGPDVPEPGPKTTGKALPAYWHAEGVALPELADAAWSDGVKAFVTRGVQAAPSDPASAFLELKSALDHALDATTPVQKAWLEEQMAALRPAACAMLQLDFDAAVAVGDVHTAVVVMAVAARFDGFRLNGIERLGAARQALFDGAPSAYRIWQLTDVQARKLDEGRYVESGGEYTLTPNIGFELVRVTATVTNIASDGERPYSLWALTEAQRALARAARFQQDGDATPARQLARNYAFLMPGDGGLFDCSFIPQDSPLRGGPAQAEPVDGPIGVVGVDCVPIPVSQGESITFDGIFGVPEGATGLRLWISGAVPEAASPSLSGTSGTQSVRSDRSDRSGRDTLDPEPETTIP
jgi:hypothetical protein